MSAADVNRSSRDAVLSILAVVRSIPYGRVANYGQVAARAGLRGRARLVAWALKQVTQEDPVPWHRVLRSDGRIAFPAGSSSHAEQLHRLQREQVKLMNGRVQKAQFAWREADLDAQLWRQDA
ncbi:MAG: MGMT family protein [Pseudomonadota bacterium]|nr:MGMT family protein [Pseudomonadota bacterium]